MARSRIVELTSRMPFTGRSVVRPDYLEGRDAALQGDVKTRNNRARRIFGMATANGAIAAGAVVVTAAQMYVSLRNGSMLHGVEGVYDAAYAAGHGMSTYTQLYLGRRLLQMTPEAQAPVEAPAAQANYETPSTTMAKAVTYGGFALYLATSVHVNNAM